MINIREAHPQDAPAICAFDQIARHSEPRRAFVHQAVESGSAWVATSEGGVVGYLVLDYTFYDCGFIRMLYIHPGHRRQGVGTELLRHAGAVCATDRLFTFTNQSNLPMRALLRKMGFMPSGRIDNLDEGDPELVFCKRLETGSREP